MAKISAPCPRLVTIDTMMEHGGTSRDVDIEELYHITSGTGDFQIAHYPQDKGDFDYVCNQVASLRHTALAIDEYAIWYPHANMQPNEHILAIVRCGRKLDQQLFVITQSPNAINKAITGQAAIWVFFMEGANDAKWIRERTKGLIDSTTLQPPIEGQSGHVAKYFAGKREDFILDFATLELTPFTP
jgi:hypothetical protein